MAGVDTPLLAEVGDGVMLMAPADENADRGRPMQANERRWRAVARELAVREAMLALLAGLFVGSCKREADAMSNWDDGRTDGSIILLGGALKVPAPPIFTSLSKNTH